MPEKTHAEVMQMVADDAEADALKLDATPFTPRGVGEHLGQIYASLQAVALAVKALHEERA